MRRPCLSACAAALALLPLAALANSVTTDLYGKSCTVLESHRKGATSTRPCKGTAGFALLVHENEGRSSIDIVAPGKQAYQLDFWDVVEPGMTFIGRKAEWHLVRGAPRALLVRVDLIDNSNIHYPRKGTAIAVARIDADGACVTFKVDAARRGAQEAARRAASDRSRKCLGAFSGAAMPTPM